MTLKNMLSEKRKVCEFKIREKTAEAGVPERPELLTVATVTKLTPVNIYHSLLLGVWTHQGNEF